ncbi:MAG: hypothetical protein RLZZ623_2712 [Actinomycetota bacterium]
MSRIRAAFSDLRHLMSSHAVLSMNGIDRQRYFRLAGRLRMIAVAALATLLLWLLRDHSVPFLVLIAFVTYPGVLVTWLTLRHVGVFAPHVWLRDIVSMAFFAAIAPDYIVPAMMCSLMILAFCSYTIEHRATALLSATSIVAIAVAGVWAHQDVPWVVLAFYPLAVIGIVLPISLVSASLQRARETTNRIADVLGLCLWETSDSVGVPGSTDYIIYGNTAPLFGDAANLLITDGEWQSLLHPDDAAIGAKIDQAVAAGEDYRVRYRQLHDDGTYRWIEELGHVEVDATGAPIRVSGLTNDIDSIVRAGEKLDRLDSIVESFPIAVTILELIDVTDPLSLTIVYENDAARKVNPALDRLGQRMIDVDPRLFDTERHRGLGFRMGEVAAGGESFVVPDAHIRYDGITRLHSLRASPLPGHRAVLIIEDVHDLFEARAELERTAFVDPLTELPNRIRMCQWLTAASVGSVLIVLDLDRFTDVNDAFGHTCGDELIVEIARVLLDAPDGVEVARLGGDEFGILAPPGNGTHAELGRRIEAALRRPFTLPNGLTLQASVSIGITTKNNADTPADELLRQADVAVNRAKRLQSNIEVYSPSTDTSAPHRMMLMGEIRRAIRSRELELQYQRIVECATGRTARFEALLRWRHPALGLLHTGDLVDMMELSNLNNDLVRHSLELAIEQCKEWQTDGILIPVSINVGGGTVHDVELIDFIISAVGAAALPPLTIGVELAERNLLLGSGISAESTRRLSQAGIWISIDHFGTGTSPLAALPHVSANALKMSKDVVDGLSGGSGSVLQAMATVIHNLGLVFGVCGVDDSTTPQWLIENGADRMQGSAIGEPLSGRELRQHMSTEFSL